MVQPVFRIALIASALFLSVACSRQTAEEKGKELVAEKAGMVKGIGDALQEKGAEAAQSVAHGAGNVLQGASTGLDEAFAWKVVSTDSMSKSGVTVSRVQHGKATDKSSKTVDAYLIANAPVQGSLQMIVYDVAKREVGRAKVNVKMAANDARYETFELDERADLGLVREVSFDLQPAAGEPAPAKKGG